MITLTKIDEVLKKILQKNIRMTLKNKLYKHGRLILFKHNNYHIEFMIVDDASKRRKKVEIPIPYNIEQWNKEQTIYFDYRLDTLAYKNEKILNMLKLLPKTGNSKFYNNILEIKYE